MSQQNKNLHATVEKPSEKAEKVTPAETAKAQPVPVAPVEPKPIVKRHRSKQEQLTALVHAHATVEVDLFAAIGVTAEAFDKLFAASVEFNKRVSNLLQSVNPFSVAVTVRNALFSSDLINERNTERSFRYTLAESAECLEDTFSVPSLDGLILIACMARGVKTVHITTVNDLTHANVLNYPSVVEHATKILA